MINNMPSVSTKYRRCQQINFGKFSPRKIKQDVFDTARFYENEYKPSLSRLDKGGPHMASMSSHGASFNELISYPDSTINYKQMVESKTNMKSKVKSLSNFSK
jgi:hypothetical protein